MLGKTHTFPAIIQEVHLDSFGHMNNAHYLTLFEQARWDLLANNGYGLDVIRKTGLGPVILQIKIDFQKELRHREAVIIETRMIKQGRKVGVLEQKMVRDGVVCCVAEFTMGFFSLAERKLITPTPEWLKVIGVDPAMITP